MAGLGDRLAARVAGEIGDISSNFDTHRTRCKMLRWPGPGHPAVGQERAGGGCPLACNRYLADAVAPRVWRLHRGALRALGNRWLEVLWHCLRQGAAAESAGRRARRQPARAFRSAPVPGSRAYHADMGRPGSMPACKEWAVVVDALLRGQQVLDLRKGGLHEPGRAFSLPAPRFWLFPTYEHQQAELLKPAHRSALERVRAERVDGVVHLRGWAEVVGVARVTEPRQLADLEDEFIWTIDYAAKRLRWKRRQPLWLMALRVWRLHRPLVTPERPDYRGCTSWVTLHDTPDDPVTLPTAPVLATAELERRLSTVGAAIPGGLLAPLKGGVHG